VNIVFTFCCPVLSHCLYSALLLSYDIYFQRVGDRHTNKENLSFMCNINKA